MKNHAAILGAGVVVGIVVVATAGIIVFNSFRVSAPEPQQATNQTPEATQDTSQSPETPQAQVVEVVIKDRAFSPSRVTIKKGTTVKWVNKDFMGHNVVSDSNAPAGGPPQDASLLNKDQVFEFTFNTVGVFSYHCTPHPDMTGTIEVTQ